MKEENDHLQEVEELKMKLLWNLNEEVRYMRIIGGA